MSKLSTILDRATDGHRPSRQEAMVLARSADVGALTATAQDLTLACHQRLVTYSRKVFIPLTHLCRDVCHYCTFATTPKNNEPAFLSPEQVLQIARAGADAGCKEALFTLGDRPELRYKAAREALADLGHLSTLSYLEAMAQLTLDETGLVPHLNPGVMSRDELTKLRRVSASMGLMLESTSVRLCAKGGPHWGSPDKLPAVRLDTIRAAGELHIPFTTGVLIGIGETREERVDTLLAIRDAHEAHGHIQEIIIQNFRAKPATLMAAAPEPSLTEQVWSIAVARIIFGGEMTIQAPPNLRPHAHGQLIGAGVNDWGGVSPVTPDHVNPEAPWPRLDELAAATASAGRLLVERLTIHPAYLRAPDNWLDPSIRPSVLRLSDSCGFARDSDWFAGIPTALPRVGGLKAGCTGKLSMQIQEILKRTMLGEPLGKQDIVLLFAARGRDFDAVVAAADQLRRTTVGDDVTFVVNRNINYTNVCYYRCGFCAFSKGRTADSLRGKPYDLADEEIMRRVSEAWERGATEVCLQGGIHPDYTGDTYLRIISLVKSAAPDIHLHAFSPLEITHGATTLGIPILEFLSELKDAGLASLPGTAAEILDDDVRALICPDKLSSSEWLDVMASAHRTGLRATATIMFGHVDSPQHWARHLHKIRALQAETGGFTEFVPLPFVHTEAPIWRKGRARSGPTLRESILMHALARLVLHPLIENVQTSWVKMGAEGAALCLRAGANDLGGVLMNESITRAAGGRHGQELDPSRLEQIILQCQRTPRQRTTLYGRVSPERRAAAHSAEPLTTVVNSPLHRLSKPSNSVSNTRKDDRPTSGMQAMRSSVVE
jgi:FO synthase